MQCNSVKSRSTLQSDSTGNTASKTKHRVGNATFALVEESNARTKRDLQHADVGVEPTLDVSKQPQRTAAKSMKTN